MSGSKVPHVVIVGGGFAGLEAARILNHPSVRVTVIDRRNHHVFQPLLYQVATAALSPGDIASPIRWILRDQANLRVMMAEVARVEAQQNILMLADGEQVGYDFLILAPGAAHSYFGHDEWAASSPGLKTLDDALTIRARMLLAFEQAEREADPERQRVLLTFAIVGGGPTGVELAGALAEIAHHTVKHEFDLADPDSSRIVLIEAGPTILPAFSEPLRSFARRTLRKLRVEVWEQSAVTGITPDQLTIKRSDGSEERLFAHTVLWAAGVAASPLGATLGVPLDRAGRVTVQPDLTVPGYPAVFVVGDLAYFVQKGRTLPGVAQVAKQQGAHAARNVLRAVAGKSSTPFVYRDPGNMATIGRGAAIADFGWTYVTGVVGWLMWLFVHVLFLIGFRNRLSVLLQWAVAYMTYQRSVRLITGRDLESSK
jgi:NADH dehydrogenase